MPRKRKSNLSQTSSYESSWIYQTLPQAELRRPEQVEREAAHRAAETPEQSQARRQQNAEYMASQMASETPEQSQARLTWRLKEIRKPLKQLNVADALLLKGHNSDI
ncbi:hypothetical protein TNCV_3533431 [Trichonephila clavipes]|nr:hypothetical protein TNCV_3533431 [Trichonephila clavipes]